MLFPCVLLDKTLHFVQQISRDGIFNWNTNEFLCINFGNNRNFGIGHITPFYFSSDSRLDMVNIGRQYTRIEYFLASWTNMFWLRE